MTEPTFATTGAFHDLLDLIGNADALFLTGDRAVKDPVLVLEGYRWRRMRSRPSEGRPSRRRHSTIRGRSPECVFWNLCLWNPYLQTYDYRYEQVTINGTQVAYEDDGSWALVVSATDPGMPNWLSTAGHPRGLLWFRWFLAESMPDRPTTEVVKITP